MSNITPVQNNLPEASQYITKMLDSIKEDFLAVNDGMDFDFVNIGTWLYTDKKGNFVEKDANGAVIENYGDQLDVVVGYGEKRWTLWGKKNTPEEGVLITAKRDRAEAEEELLAYLQEHPDTQTRYDVKSLDLRYIAYVVPVITLVPNDFPKIYLLGMPKTTTIQWGKYAQGIYLGKGVKALVPARTGINRVVTRMTTSEKGTGNETWIGIDFEAIGLFDPRDYGIKWNPNEQQPAATAATDPAAAAAASTPANAQETVAAGADAF